MTKKEAVQRVLIARISQCGIFLSKIRHIVMKATHLCLLSSLALMATASPLAGQKFNGKKITDIEIQYVGDKTVDEQRLINFMSSQVGTRYNADKIDRDIRALKKAGLIDNIAFSGKGHKGGVKLTAKVITRPVLASVGFIGNSKYSDKKLARTTKLETGKILGEGQALAAKRKIQKLYTDANFPDVFISHRLQKTTRAGHADLIFTIDEGNKNTIRKIHFQGNTAFDHNLLYKEIQTKKKGLFSFFTKSGRIDNDKLDEDVERIIDFYKDNGYLKASSPGAEIVPIKGDKVDIYIPINEGVKYKVNKVSFGPMSVFTPQQLLPTLLLDPGDAYSQSQLREDIVTIRSYYGSKGYADVRVSPQITNASNNTINIRYNILEGKPSKVGRININGNSITKDKVIRREVTLRPGEPFNSTELKTIKNRLKSLNYFEPIYVEDRPSVQAGYRDVDITVREKKTGNLSFGAGLSSIDNIVGYAGIEQRNFDITNWRGGFRGGGQRLNLNLKAGGETTDATLSLVEPWFLGKKLEAGVSLYYRDLLFLSDEYDLTKAGGTIHLRKALGKSSSIRAEYKWESNDVDVEDRLNGTGSAFEQFEGKTERSSITLSYIHDTRNAIVQPRKGHKVDLGLTYSFGDSETYTIFARSQKHWNFKYDTILSIKSEYSTTDTHGDNGTIPIYDRQFLGGQRNLRGFEFNDIGPRDGVSEEVFGGATKAFFTAEATIPIVDNVRGAVFADTGFVSKDSWDFASDPYVDAGVGLRLNLPIGPVAIDYAFPLKSPDPEADKGPQFNFYLNYNF